jgi:hypothetical protein
MISYKLRLDTRASQKRKSGFPVSVFLFQNKKQKKFNLGVNFELIDWDFDKNEPKVDPRSQLLIRKKKLLLDEIVYKSSYERFISLDEAKSIVLGEIKSIDSDDFYEFADVFIQELLKNGKDSNAAAYQNAITQLKKFRAKMSFKDINYSTLNQFKQFRLRMGNSKNTVHTYLRKYRALYNEAVRRLPIKNQNPFDGVFKGVTVKANRTKKRYIDKDGISFLESINGLTSSHQRSLDLWLLSFYLGGQNLQDLYYLKHSQINNGRVFFTRGKLDETGYEYDLKIVPKAQKIIDKYYVDGEYLFPWRKDYTGRDTFRHNLRRSLLFIQDQYNIEVLPKGGNFTIQVARHSFATIGKQLFIDSDLLRELMGHERSDIDTVYKDRFPEEVRDKEHFKIIT